MQNLIFDGTILANELYSGASRTGVFFVAKNLFFELLKRDDIKLYLYCNPEKMPDLKNVLKIYNSDKLEIINECEFSLLWDLALRLRVRKYKLGGFCRFLVACLSEGLIVLAKFFNQLNFRQFCLKNIDFYFSPVYKVPNCIKKQKHITSAIFLHDTIPLIYKEFYPQINKKYWFTELVKSFSENEIYFANSFSTKNDFLKYCPTLNVNQIEVAYLGVDDNTFKPVTENFGLSNKYIFSLCSIEPRKNLAFAIRNFLEFIKENDIDDLKLVMSGATWDDFKLQIPTECIQEFKNKVVFTGYMPDSDLAKLFSNALCFVYPSLYEGFGLPVLEAMKCGCPVITSNRASLPEVLGDCGVAINPEDDFQIKEAYKRFYYDELFRKECSTKGLERAKLFSWQKCADIIIDKLGRCR